VLIVVLGVLLLLRRRHLNKRPVFAGDAKPLGDEAEPDQAEPDEDPTPLAEGEPAPEAGSEPKPEP
jgi:hypothetical protein